MTNQVVIVGDRADAHLAAVVRALDLLGGPEPVVVDAARLMADPYTLVPGDRLTVGGSTLSLREPSRGWLRRSAPSVWGAGLVTGSLDAVKHRAFLTLVGSLSRLCSVSWVTPIDAMIRGEDRLAQLEAVAEAGHRTPRTVVTSSADVARAALGDQFIVKPLAMGYFQTKSGPRAVYTAELAADDLARVDFADAPFAAQERIEAVEHLRVVTVGSSAWVASLSAAGRPLDWRQQEEAHRSWEPADNPATASAAVDVARAFGLGYSSQDWIVDGAGTAVFVDLNPAGQWLFLPDEVAQPVTAAIARFLAGPS